MYVCILYYVVIYSFVCMCVYILIHICVYIYIYIYFEVLLSFAGLLYIFFYDFDFVGRGLRPLSYKQYIQITYKSCKMHIKHIYKSYKNHENWTKRRCLWCRKIFDSSGIGNRLCKSCK